MNGPLKSRPKEAHWDLPNDLDAVAKCRGMTRGTLSAWGIEGELLEDVVLTVSELYANAIRHVKAPIGQGLLITLTLRLRDRCLNGEVIDCGDVFVPRQRTPESIGGRGLEIVAALVDEWGITPGRAGKAVWFRKCW